MSEGSLHVVTPEAALDDASVAARTGIPLDRLLRTVWACHTAVQQALLDVIGATVPPGSLLLEIRRQNDMLATFMDRYVSDISATYARERLESESRILVERRRVVDSLLDGDEPSSEGERILGISWREYHLAALGWASGGNRTFDSDNSAFRFAERVALRHRASAWLIIERGDHVEFHWSFIHDAPIDVDIIEQELPSRMRLALGLVQSGANGFRSTTVAARRTRDVCLQMPGAQMVTHYDDVSLLALVAADQEHARAFVQRELTGLLGEDPMSVSIRQSLRLFLVAGRSRQLAAEASHVAPTTIAYRVKRAEEKLDRSTLLRPQELLAALELVHAFPQLSVPTSPRE
ncbi:helix-turn-helix domain-containing protein [Microbacterium sp. CH12i]|uniref:helix-turn-helix domain-containing protein n=1 Tax=Microbacterium sp. CH12i TaxID=1479651 RepID=UPI00136401D4|nr:helix-turn-helix domain-containing protein [Microbacterium sp. CH12i]